MEEPRISRARERIGEHVRPFRRNVEPEDLHRDEAVARRFVGTKDGAERANADLMQDPEGAKRGRWGEGRRIVDGQGPCSWSIAMGSKESNTVYNRDQPADSPGIFAPSRRVELHPRGFAPRTPLHRRSRGPRRPRSGGARLWRAESVMRRVGYAVRQNEKFSWRAAYRTTVIALTCFGRL